VFVATIALMAGLLAAILAPGLGITTEKVINAFVYIYPLSILIGIAVFYGVKLKGIKTFSGITEQIYERYWYVALAIMLTFWGPGTSVPFIKLVGFPFLISMIILQLHLIWKYWKVAPFALLANSICISLITTVYILF